MYQLRDYQQQSVDAVIKHFRKTSDPAVVVLPTGAGKSLVIAELARLARFPILVITHVKELVQQNHEKYQLTGMPASIFSAGLNQKENQHQVTFASIQSLAKNLETFNQFYSLIIIDECHRVSLDSESQYQKCISHLKQYNKDLKVLGLTATPYRLGTGWIYKKHYQGFVRNTEQTVFKDCIYELPLRYLIKKNFLTPAKLINAGIEQYNFDALKTNRFGEPLESEVNELLAKYPRVTEGICQQIQDNSHDKQGVMIFAATRKHAKEVLGYLPQNEAALIDGETPSVEREAIINQFKQQQLKYLVNISVLTTGFDAPHVDFIAILRKTESVSLYQQIIGRGLRLAKNKKECLVIDYAGNKHSLFEPEVGEKKPNDQVKPVQVPCPSCGFANTFWGITDDDHNIIEHYGRRCQGLLENSEGTESEQCDFRFKFKNCNHCNAENDIAARDCQTCGQPMIDPDDMLRKALKLSDYKVFRCAGMELIETTVKDQQQLKAIYHDEDGEEVSEVFFIDSKKGLANFNQIFSRRSHSEFLMSPFTSLSDILKHQSEIKAPDFIICQQEKRYLKVKERIFDYEGNHRKANSL